MIQTRAVEKGRGLFLATLAGYQYALMSAAFVDIRFGSANLQVTTMTLLLIACVSVARERVVDLLGWQAVIVLALGVVFIPFKILAGLLHPQGIQAMRIFFILPLVWSFYAAYVSDEEMRQKVATILIANCAFIAVFGIVHFVFFPTVFFSSTVTEAYRAGNISLIPGHSQEAAFVGNPSAYGALLVTGMFAIYLMRRTSLTYVVAFMLMLFASYLSVSRSTAFFATLVAVLYLVGQASPKRPLSFAPIILIVAAVAYLLSRIPILLLAMTAAMARLGLFSFGRGGTASSVLGQLGEGRLLAYKVGLQIAFSDLSHVLLGSRDTEDIVIGDVNFSDNSFIFLALGFGVPLAALWIATILRRTVPIRWPCSLAQGLTVFFIYVTLITTPSLSWDIWILYAIGLLFISTAPVPVSPLPSPARVNAVPSPPPAHAL